MDTQIQTEPRIEIKSHHKVLTVVDLAITAGLPEKREDFLECKDGELIFKRQQAPVVAASTKPPVEAKFVSVTVMGLERLAEANAILSHYEIFTMQPAYDLTEEQLLAVPSVGQSTVEKFKAAIESVREQMTVAPRPLRIATQTKVQKGNSRGTPPVDVLVAIMNDHGKAISGPVLETEYRRRTGRPTKFRSLYGNLLTKHKAIFKHRGDDWDLVDRPTPKEGTPAAL